MSWQHWVIASIFIVCIWAMPVGIGEQREMWTRSKAITGAVIFLAMLVLLVWGQP